MALTNKQVAFVREYLVDRNATQAAIRAGYSKKTAYSIGQENLNKPEIAQAVQDGEEKHAERCAVTIEKISENLARIGASAEMENQLAVARQAQMDLAKLHGLIVDKAENKNETNHTGEVKRKVVFNPVGRDD